jgi:hypothetical protein
MSLEMSRVRELDYDYLKSYVRPPADTMAAATEAAHQLGIPVATHLMAPGFYVGQDTTTHLNGTQRLGYSRVLSQTNFSYDDVVAVYAERAVNPTIAPNRLLWPHDCEGDPRAQLFPSWKAVNCGPEPDPDPQCLTSQCRRADTLARIRDAGGLVVAGTDFPLGGDLPFTLHAELRALVLYGWTPYEALVTATRNAAEFIGVQDDLGTLEPGKLADMVFVEGNPLERIEDAINVQMVMKNGRLFTPEEILEDFFGGPGTDGRRAEAGEALEAEHLEGRPGREVEVRTGPLAKLEHRWLPPVPDHPSNEAFWWHQPEQVKEDYLMTES